MKRHLLRLACASLLLLGPPAAAWWPLDSEGGGAPQQAQSLGQVIAGGRGGGPIPGMHIFGNMPVVVVETHMGFDPWEDLHKNVERIVRGSAAELGQPRELQGPPVAPPALEMQLGNIVDLFGMQHAGQFGRAEGSFEVDDDHKTRILITAVLPGYKLGADAEQVGQSPLSVRALGRRSLVVSGTQQTGPFVKTWQRSFALPKGSDLDKVEVTYNSASGNLTVVVPRNNNTAVEAEDEEDDSGDGGLFDDLLPPALRAMRGALPLVMGQLGPAFGQLQARPSSGFLLPRPMVGNFLDDALGQALDTVQKAHPRYHPPPEGEKPVPEDAEVALVGCFAESQLEKVELKYYGESNAASFAAMYWHALSDHVPYFAMARHQDPIGHAFTAKGFVHEEEKPRWGVYDGCGTRCADDPARWCGCANEASRGFQNLDCSTEGEKRFAVYKIGAAAQPTQSPDASGGPAEAVPPAPGAGRPYWQLSSDTDGSGASSIEIVLPPGTVAKAQGKEVLLYDNSSASSARGAEPDRRMGSEEAKASASGAAGSEAASSEEVAAQEASADAASDAASAEARVAGQAAPAAGNPGSSATPVGKVRLPVGVDPDSCQWDPGRAPEGGGQVFKCRLDDKDVRSLPIKVIDEL